MHFDDLTVYEYHLPFCLDGVLNVGWLDPKHTFRQGPMDAKFIDALRALICGEFDGLQVHVNEIRGQHPCTLCNAHPSIGCRLRGDIGLGSSEIWVPFADTIFAAPSMILHYATDHSYLPPDDFVQAVMMLEKTGRFNGQMEFEQKLAQHVDG